MIHAIRICILCSLEHFTTENIQLNVSSEVPLGFHHVGKRETRSKAEGVMLIHKLRSTRGKKMTAISIKVNRLRLQIVQK